ncbi:MAG: Qat anti-phage system TatD family nuclease QatD [Acidobacteriota bacterium]
MKHNLVDFHCHLDLFPDPASAVIDADRAGVYTLAVTTTPRAWPRNYDLTRRTQHVRAALGLHPQLVADHAAEITLWESYLPQTRYVGEVGIDAGPRYYRSLDLQRQVFERVLKQCAKAGSKVLTVHSVRAATVVLDMIEASLPLANGRVVLHWFTGSRAEARRAVELGCYFSINAEMMQNERGRVLVGTLPSNRLLTETDGPFTHLGGRPTCPTDVIVAIEAMAKLLHATAADMAETVQVNLRTLLDETGGPDRA